MKAIICTYYNVSNYGAFLQSFSLTEYLKSLGIDVYMMKHNATDGTFFTFINRNKKSLEETQYKEKMKTRISQNASCFSLDPGKSYFDLCIVGSDEIWNVRSLSAKHYPFFFRGIRNSRIIASYAVSAGKTTSKNLRLFPYSIPGIKKLDYVSVRDQATKDLMHDIGVNNSVLVLDPTFLYDFSDHLVDSGIENCLFIYTYGVSEDIAREICRFASARNLNTVATGSLCSWASYNPIPDSFEWVSMINQSDFVVTTTFHGLALAIQRKKQFAVINPSHKMKFLLEQLGLQDRIYNQRDNSLNKIGDQKIDYKRVDQLLSNKIDFSKKYLETVINAAKE